MMQFQQMENSQHLRESNFSKVTWLDSKKRTCNLQVASALGVYGNCFQGSATAQWCGRSRNSPLALSPQKIWGTFYPLTFSQRLLPPRPENLFRVASGCPTLPDHKIESHKRGPGKASLPSQHLWTTRCQLCRACVLDHIQREPMK